MYVWLTLLCTLPYCANGVPYHAHFTTLPLTLSYRLNAFPYCTHYLGVPIILLRPVLPYGTHHIIARMPYTAVRVVLIYTSPCRTHSAPHQSENLE